EGGKISHYIINFKGSYYQIGDQTFQTLPEIIGFYKNYLLDTTTLKEPFNTCSNGSFQVAKLEEWKAMFNFDSKDPEDLPFKKGDILTIVKKVEENWWRARDNKGREGMIPKTYVQLVAPFNIFDIRNDGFEYAVAVMDHFKPYDDSLLSFKYQHMATPLHSMYRDTTFSLETIVSTQGYTIAQDLVCLIISWFHGYLSRPKTEGILSGKTPGTFLVRESSTIPGDYVLSVSESSKVSHYIINFKGTCYQIGEQTFQNLPDIIDFYKRHFLDTTTLKDPDPEDLAFKKGDILTVVKKEEEHWWRARDATGKEGMIPKPYVQLIPPTGATGSPNTPAGRSKSRTSIDCSVPPPPVAMPQNIPNDGFEYAVAIMDRVVPYDNTQLLFKKGELIKIIKKHEDGSWFGEVKNKTGKFPFNYVQIVDRDDRNGV
ncbi:hypothetical protein QZH41_015660, partial [Actinostola sp. cb2023]